VHVANTVCRWHPSKHLLLRQSQLHVGGNLAATVQFFSPIAGWAPSAVAACHLLAWRTLPCAVMQAANNAVVCNKCLERTTPVPALWATIEGAVLLSDLCMLQMMWPSFSWRSLSSCTSTTSTTTSVSTELAVPTAWHCHGAWLDGMPGTGTP
jgi:hypothetical protein